MHQEDTVRIMGRMTRDAMYERKISAEDTQVLYQAVLEDIHADAYVGLTCWMSPL